MLLTFIFLPWSVSPLPSAPWHEAHLDFHSRSVFLSGAPCANALPEMANAMRSGAPRRNQTAFRLNADMLFTPSSVDKGERTDSRCCGLFQLQNQLARRDIPRMSRSAHPATDRC